MLPSLFSAAIQDFAFVPLASLLFIWALLILSPLSLPICGSLFSLFLPNSSLFPQVSWIYSQDPHIQRYRQALYRVAWDALPFIEHMATARAGGGAEAYVSQGGRKEGREAC